MERIAEQMRRENVAGGSSGGGRLPTLELPEGRRIPQEPVAARESRLLHLAEEVYSAVELSIRHQEALWGIVILNSHEGPFHSDAIPPSLLPNLHAKMDASIEFSQLALVRLQELRALLPKTRFTYSQTTGFSFPQVVAGQLGVGGAFTAGGWTPRQRSPATGTASASGGAGPGNTVSPTPKPVRPCMPLAPLKVPMRPTACQLHGTPAPSPELSRANTPAIYTAFRGNTDTRAMAGASVSPRPDFLEPLVPPSFFASLAVPPQQETSHFPELNSSELEILLRSYDTQTGTGNTFDAGPRTVTSTMISSLPQPPNTAWLDSDPSTQAQPSPAGMYSDVLTPRRPIRTRSPRVSMLKRANPLGQRQYLQHGADPSKDIPSDGYSWRKYGQKTIRNSSHERCYYKCSGVDVELSTAEKKVHCKGKKQVQRSDEDPAMFIVYHRTGHTCGRGRGRGSSSASARRQDGVAPTAQFPKHRYSHQAGIMSDLPTMPLVGGLRQGMEAQPPLLQARPLGAEFRCGTSETGTSDSSKASDFLFESDQDLGTLHDLPPFPILQTPWVEAPTAAQIPLNQMKSLLLDDHIVDDAGN